MDPGEDEAQTALREVSEESGLQAADLKVIPGFEKVLHVSHLFRRDMRYAHEF